MKKKIAFFLRRWALARAQAIVTAADEWLHRREITMRAEIARASYQAEVDPAASAAREREHRKFAGVSADGCSSASLTIRRKTTGARPRLSAVRMGPRRQTPHLKYEHGAFVRTER
jgi:hypothetical protein